MPPRELLIDRHASSDFLVSSSGLPVWPAQSPEDRAIVQAAARLCDASLREVRGSPGMTTPGTELVVNTGADTEHAAKLFAHLTRRRFQTVKHPHAILDLGPPSVVVLKHELLTASLLDRLYNSKRDWVPGLLCATDPSSLRLQALIRATAVLPPGIRHRVDVLPTSDIIVTKSGTRPLRARNVRAALRGGAGLLNLTTHSDGVDAFLGGAQTFCSLEAAPSPHQADAPVCVVSGYCHRHHRPIDEALAEGLFFSPKQVSARVFFFCGCSGLLVAGSPVGARWSLTARLLSNPRVIALITTWGLNFLDLTKLDPLLRDLEQGMEVGRALARFKASRLGRTGAVRFCLFGDPHATASAATLPASHASTIHVVREKRSKRETKEFQESTLARLLLNLDKFRGEANPDANGAAKSIERRRATLAALSSLSMYEQMFWNVGTPSSLLESAAAEYRTNLLEVLCGWGRLTDDWLSFAELCQRWTASRCWACGAVARQSRFRFSAPGVSPRRMTACDRCGVIENAAEHFKGRLELDLKASTVRLRGGFPRERWVASVVLNSSHEPFHRHWRWPAGPDGRPRRSLKIDFRESPGANHLSFLMIHSGAISCLGMDFQGGAPGRALEPGA